MKAAIYYQAGAPDVLRYEDVPDPVCGENEVLIKVEAIAVEGGDFINRATVEPPATGRIVGYSAAGTIIAVGEKVENRQPGQRVATMAMEGSHAELRVAPADWTWLIPESLDFATASVVPIAFGTAYQGLMSRRELKIGDTVLIQGGAGGVGVAAIQIAKHQGAKVIATLAGEERAGRLRELGLDKAIDYERQDVVAEVNAFTNGQGADMVLDLAGSTLGQSSAALKEWGWLIMAGNAGGMTTTDLWPAQQANQTISGLFWGREVAKPEARAVVDTLLEDVAAGKLKVVIEREFKLSEAATAHRYAENHKVLGRIVLTP